MRYSICFVEFKTFSFIKFFTVYSSIVHASGVSESEKYALKRQHLNGELVCFYRNRFRFLYYRFAPQCQFDCNATELVIC